MNGLFEPIWLGISLFALACWALGGMLTLFGLVLRLSSDYWKRQMERMDAGLDTEPEPWYVRLTTAMHGSRLFRRLLG